MEPCAGRQVQTQRPAWEELAIGLQGKMRPHFSYRVSQSPGKHEALGRSAMEGAWAYFSASHGTISSRLGP